VRRSDLLQSALESGKRERKAGEYTILCPFCEARIGTPDVTGNLGVNVLKGAFYCWRCHWGGSLRYLLKQAEKGGLLEPVRQIDLRAALRPLESLPVASPVGFPAYPLPGGFVYLATAPGGFGGHATAYLRGRGVTPAQEQKLRPGYTTQESARGERDWRGRVIFPVFLGGQVVYFVCRSWGSAEPKALNPPLPEGLGRPIWGLDAIPLGGGVVLCEGILSAAAVPNGVAVLGSSLTEVQLFLLLSRIPSQIVVFFDADDAGRQGARDVAERLRKIWPGELRVASLAVEGKDPGDYLGEPGVIAEALRGASPFGLTDSLRTLAGIRRR
jgi:hypothetical protein